MEMKDTPGESKTVYKERMRPNKVSRGVRRGKTKRLYAVFAVIFFAVCAVPVYSMPFIRESLASEKRSLSDRPVLIEDGKVNADFTAQADRYLSEHFSFRGDLVNALNVIEAKVFATSGEEQVIIGRDGWLYFSRTLADYTGSGRMTDRQVDELAAVLSLINEYAKSRGAAFLFFAAPNKNTIYPEYMPARYIRTDEPTNLKRLTSKLAGEEWYLNLRDVLEADAGHADVTSHEAQAGETEAAKDAGNFLYLTRDTHWNAKGALLCYEAATRRLGNEALSFSQAGQSVENTLRGDLDTMLFPRMKRLSEQVICNYDFSYEYVSRYRSEEDIRIETAHPAGGGSLLMFRDSFTNALLPYFAETFSKASFRRDVPYRLDALEDGSYTDVIIEIVERNLATLLETAPVMPALRREAADLPAGTSPKEPVRLASEKSFGMLHVYGSVADPGFSHIYISCRVDGEERIFEAFPIYEEALYNSEKRSHQGSSEGRETSEAADSGESHDSMEDPSGGVGSSSGAGHKGEAGFSAYLPEDADVTDMRILVGKVR